MSKIFSFIVFFFPFGSCCALEIPALVNKPLVANELQTLNELIACTQHTLDVQITLREKIINYQELQKQYSDDDENYELLYRLAKSALVILETIKEQHLLQTFDAAFINELTLISKPAAKRGIPKP